MKRVFVGILSFALLATPTLAMASSQDAEQLKNNGPVELTDAEMDNVTGGQLIEVEVRNNEIVKNVNVGVGVAASAAVAVLGAAASSPAVVRFVQIP